MNGVLVVDKPLGVTSHDVVQKLRRALRIKSVGHTGTLDPLASGVLVLAVGEGTKLVAHLQMADKRYDFTIQLGTITNTLDSEGEVIEEAAVPALELDAIQASANTFLGTNSQQVPAFSAVKVDGVALHKRARRGEKVDAPSRDVELFEVQVLDFDDENKIKISIHCGKGFYVRSFARDLAAALGTVGHVIALRRTTCGSFSLSESFDGEAIDKERVAEIQERILPLPIACRDLTCVNIDQAGAVEAGYGRLVPKKETPKGDAPFALLYEGRLIAIAREEGEHFKVVRGFVHNDASVGREK